MKLRATWEDASPDFPTGIRLRYWPEDEEERRAVIKSYEALGDPARLCLMSFVVELPEKRGTLGMTLELAKVGEAN